MPVSTKGSVKHISPTELETMGYECWISNSLLFSFRPGLETIEKAGGLHEFSGWNHGIFTDSGGFQILREKFFLRIGDEGVHFKNPFDQSEVLLSPEQSMIIQMRLRSDVAMCLDDVPAFNSTPFRIADSLRRTTDWAKRCLAAHSPHPASRSRALPASPRTRARHPRALPASPRTRPLSVALPMTA